MKALALLTVWNASSRGFELCTGMGEYVLLNPLHRFYHMETEGYWAVVFFGAMGGLLLWMGMIIECLHNLGTMSVLSEVCNTPWKIHSAGHSLRTQLVMFSALGAGGCRWDLVLASWVQMSVSNRVKKVLRLLGRDAAILPVNRVISGSIHSHHALQTLPGCTKVPLSKFLSAFFFNISGWWSWQLFWPPYWSLFFPPLRDREDFFLLMISFSFFLPQGLLLVKVVTVFEGMMSTQIDVRGDHLVISVFRRRRGFSSQWSPDIPGKQWCPPLSIVYWSWSPSWLS